MSTKQVNVREAYPVGAIVKHTAKFLKSVGGATGWPKNGKVTGYSDEIPSWIRVAWSDGNECLVNVANIMCHKKPDYSGM